jgi:hypothetical protein
MKKLDILSVVAAIFFLTIPMVSYAETAQECASNCVNKCSPLGSGKEYATCLENCLKRCYDKPTGVPPVPAPSKSEVSTPKLYAKAEGRDWYTIDKMESQNTHGKPLMLAQNATYLACYKQVDMKMVLFRWCPTGSPWTATNNNRTNCYATSEACAKAEMPQSWCIKCGIND